ncbi:MAG: DUF1360 domain-containing protein [Actinomycetota bacterium]
MRPTTTPLQAAILVGATYRLTHLVVDDDLAPVTRVRDAYIRRVGKDSAWAELIGCYWCSGVWIAAAVLASYALWPGVIRMMAVPAVSAAVGLVSEWEQR